MQCSICKQEITKPKNNIGSGYGLDQNGRKVCYSCCGDLDKKEMINSGRIILYLTYHDGIPFVSNWPNSLAFQCFDHSRGRHNFGLNRYDVWFRFNGFIWHGYTIGDNTEICHCKQTKRVA